MVIQVIGAFAAVCTIAVYFGVPKRFLPYSGLVGAISWLIYLLMSELLENAGTSMFIASIALTLVSHIFARVFKAPVTLFLVSGILPLVPGVGMYRIVYYLIIGEMEQATHHLYLTAQAAGVIALAIFIMDTCFRLLKPKHSVTNTLTAPMRDGAAMSVQPAVGSEQSSERAQSEVESERRSECAQSEVGSERSSDQAGSNDGRRQ